MISSRSEKSYFQIPYILVNLVIGHDHELYELAILASSKEVLPPRTFLKVQQNSFGLFAESKVA